MFTNWRKKSPQSAVLSDTLIKQQRYDNLVKTLHADIFRYAFWLCGERQRAEDITQETFLRAWRALDTLKDDNAAKAWLFTILRHENARQFERKQFDYADVAEDSLEDPLKETAEAQTEQYWLRRHIAQLDIEYREPLLLQLIAGFSGEEIAQLLQLNHNTVMTRLFRAKNQLKERLEKTALRGHANG